MERLGSAVTLVVLNNSCLASVWELKPFQKQKVPSRLFRIRDA